MYGETRDVMRVLFLTGAYHPYYSANGLCVKNVVDESVARGMDVTCMVNSAKGLPRDGMLDGARVYRITPRLFIRWQQYASEHDSKLVKQLDRIARFANKVKMFIRSGSWPQVSRGYTNRFFKAACRLHEENPFDVVVAAYTPVDTLLAGYRLKKKYPDLIYVPYYLDALAGGWGPAAWSLEKTEKQTRRLESLVDEAADIVVSMGSSKAYHEENPLSVSLQKKRVYLGVPMMRDLSGEEKCSVARGRPYVLFAGGIPFPRRDPRPLLELMCGACEKLDIDFLIAGECSDPSVLDPYISKSDGRVVYLGWQDKNAISGLEEGAFALANIGSSNPSTIPCKIFEYMGHSKPVISTYQIDDEPSKPYLTEYGHTFFFDERIGADEVTVDRLCSFLSLYKLNQIPSDVCESKFYANRPEALVDLLENLHNGGCDD